MIPDGRGVTRREERGERRGEEGGERRREKEREGEGRKEERRREAGEALLFLLAPSGAATGRGAGAACFAPPERRRPNAYKRPCREP